MRRASLFAPDYEHYGGVRPIQILLLRLGYVLVFVIVGYRSWTPLMNHAGPWDPYLAVALSMWASSSLLSLIGVFRPLEMIPLVLFEIGYKLTWLVIVALPLWKDGRLTDPRTEEMTYAFLPVVLPLAAMPWGYVFQTYVWSQGGRRITSG
jgi:hypothetical protein